MRSIWEATKGTGRFILSLLAGMLAVYAVILAVIYTVTLFIGVIIFMGGGHIPI